MSEQQGPLVRYSAFRRAGVTLLLLAGLTACGPGPEGDGAGPVDGATGDEGGPGDEATDADPGDTDPDPADDDPTDPTDPGEPDPTDPTELTDDERTDAEADPDPGPIVFEVVDSQAVIPTETAGRFADIATEEPDAERVWARFGLEGEPPAIREGAALLFLGTGESGSCPLLIEDLRLQDGRLEVRYDIEGGPVCTDDYNPRTFVLEVEVADLPDDGFELLHDGQTFVLSAEPLAAPPATGSTISQMTAEDPQVELELEPAQVSVGERPEVILRNDGEVHASTGGRATALQRWDERRWLPVGDQPEYETHPSIEADPAPVDPGEERTVMTLDTEELEPGWYRVVESLQLGGRGGRVDVQATVEVTSR